MVYHEAGELLASSLLDSYRRQLSLGPSLRLPTFTDQVGSFLDGRIDRYWANMECCARPASADQAAFVRQDPQLVNNALLEAMAAALPGLEILLFAPRLYYPDVAIRASVFFRDRAYAKTRSAETGLPITEQNQRRCCSTTHRGRAGQSRTFRRRDGQTEILRLCGRGSARYCGHWRCVNVREASTPLDRFGGTRWMEAFTHDVYGCGLRSRCAVVPLALLVHDLILAGPRWKPRSRGGWMVSITWPATRPPRSME